MLARPLAGLPPATGVDGTDLSPLFKEHAGGRAPPRAGTKLFFHLSEGVLPAHALREHARSGRGGKPRARSASK